MAAANKDPATQTVDLTHSAQMFVMSQSFRRWHDRCAEVVVGVTSPGLPASTTPPLQREGRPSMSNALDILISVRQ